MTQEVKTTNTNVGTDKYCVHPTTCYRQELKFLSLSQPTQAPSKGSSWLGQALQQDCSRSQPQPGFPYSSDSVPQALKAEMLFRSVHFSAPMYILTACPSPALPLLLRTLPQILRVKKEHRTSCSSTAGISSVSKQRLEHQGAALQDAQLSAGRLLLPAKQTKPQGKDRHPCATPADPLAVCHWLPPLHSQEDTEPATWVY